MMCYDRRSNVFWTPEYITPSYLSLIIATQCSYKLVWHIPIRLHKWITPLLNKCSDCLSSWFAIISSQVCTSYSICGRKHSLSTCRWSCLSLQVSRYYFHIGFMNFTNMKQDLLSLWHVSFASVNHLAMAMSCSTHLYICHHMLFLTSVKPDKNADTGVEPAISWSWAMRDNPFHSSAIFLAPFDARITQQFQRKIHENKH